jgi:hypothetical protein
MSHTVSIDTKFKDLECVFSSLRALGFTVHENQKTYNWYRKWVGDSKMADGFTWHTTRGSRYSHTFDPTKRMLGTCDHAAGYPFQSTERNYEIGIYQQARGDWGLTMDWFDPKLGAMVGNGNGDMSKIKEEYSYQVTAKWARQNGWKCTRVGSKIVLEDPTTLAKVTHSLGKLEGAGFTGHACSGPLLELAQKLGAITEVENSAEFYSVEQNIQW